MQRENFLDSIAPEIVPYENFALVPEIAYLATTREP